MITTQQISSKCGETPNSIHTFFAEKLNCQSLGFHMNKYFPVATSQNNRKNQVDRLFLVGSAKCLARRYSSGETFLLFAKRKFFDSRRFVSESKENLSQTHYFRFEKICHRKQRKFFSQRRIIYISLTLFQDEAVHGRSCTY